MPMEYIVTLDTGETPVISSYPSNMSGQAIALWSSYLSQGKKATLSNTGIISSAKAQEPASVATIIAQLPALPQRQDGTHDQLLDLVSLANKLGLYDAADCVKQLIPSTSAGQGH